jgi:two-component system heavy metal sensor histidine kinase CusS
MMRSIAVRLALAFGSIAFILFALSGFAVYRVLLQTLDRQLEDDLRSKLEVASRLVSGIDTVERWNELRNTLTTITTTDGNTRFWIACEDPALNYGFPFPDNIHPKLGSDVKSLAMKDNHYPMKTLGTTLRPIKEIPEIYLVVGVGTMPMHQTLNTFALALITIGLCGIAMVAALGYWIARFGLTPLVKLSEGAQSLGPENLSQRLVISQVTELIPLATSFNGALDRLEAAYGQLEAFSADVAHELRTPIGNIIGMTQVALTRDRSPAELRETLESNLEELERLRAIVNDMLFLARADRGERVSSMDVTSLACEVWKTVEFLEPLIEEKALLVDALGDVEAPIDKALFRRAMSNLLHNAIQYSPQGANVSVKMQQQGPDGFVEVSVSNPGMPIAAEHLTLLFDRFYRVDSSRTLSTDNHGLGLAIVKAIAKMHGGTVFARTDAGINTIGMTMVSR